MQIIIDYLCDCECTRAAQENSSGCGDKGSLECAICKCNEGYYGEICQCKETPAVDSRNSFLSCLSNRNNDTTLCSNQETCICGQCVCSKEKVSMTCS